VMSVTGPRGGAQEATSKASASTANARADMVWTVMGAQ
jgi:hypothetical protein